MDTQITAKSNYRWYILTLGVATHVFVATLPLSCMPVLFPEISADLQLDLVQIGMIWGFVNIAGMLLSMFGGMLGDKYGTARVLAASCLATGIACGLRGTASSFTSLLMFSMLFGLAQIPISLTTHKAAGQWFSGKQLGLANGILAMGMGIGGIIAAMISATIMSPLLGGWRNVMFLYATISAIFAVLWIQTKSRQAPLNTADKSNSSPDLKIAFSHVIKIKSLWILAVAQAFYAAYRGGVAGYLPSYLEGIGWSIVGASSAMSAISAASVIGVIPISIFSDRLGLRKSVLVSAHIITFTSIFLLSVNYSAVIWPAAIVMGFIQEGIAAVTITLIMETEGVGPGYAGTALGMTGTIGKFGSVFGPPLGNRMATIRPAYGFFSWGIMGVFATSQILFVKETGWRKKSQ